MHTLLDLADTHTTQGIYEWVTFPNAETQQAELVITHAFFTLSPRVSSVYTYTIYFTFSDPTTATIKLVKVIDGVGSSEEWVHDMPCIPETRNEQSEYKFSYLIENNKISVFFYLTFSSLCVIVHLTINRIIYGYHQTIR